MGDKKNRPEDIYNVLILTWPNLISLSRIASVPLIAWMMLQGYHTAAFVTCILAGLTDLLDGYVARILKTPSVFGAYLDPLADKTLLVSMYLLLGYLSLLENWVVMLVIFRDMIIIGGSLLLLMFSFPLKAKPLMISKLNTLLQIITVVYILGELAFDMSIPLLRLGLIYSVVITTILSGLAYGFVMLGYLAKNEAQNDVQ